MKTQQSIWEQTLEVEVFILIPSRLPAGQNTFWEGYSTFKHNNNNSNNNNNNNNNNHHHHHHHHHNNIIFLKIYSAILLNKMVSLRFTLHILLVATINGLIILPLWIKLLLLQYFIFTVSNGWSTCKLWVSSGRRTKEADEEGFGRLVLLNDDKNLCIYLFIGGL